MTAAEIEQQHTAAAQVLRRYVELGGKAGLILYAGVAIAHGDVALAVLDPETGRLAACRARDRDTLTQRAWPDFKAYDTPYKVAQPGSPYVDSAGRVHRWLGIAPLVGENVLLVFHREATHGRTWATPIAELYGAGFAPYDGSRKWQ